MDKAHVSDRGSPSRSVFSATKARFCKETASQFGRAAARRAAVLDFVYCLTIRVPSPLSSLRSSKLSG